MSVDFADRMTDILNFNSQLIALLNDSKAGVKIDSQAKDTLIIDALNPDLSLADYIHNLDDRPYKNKSDRNLSNLIFQASFNFSSTN